MKKFIFGAVAAVVIGLGFTAAQASAHWEVRSVQRWSPAFGSYVLTRERVWVPDEVVVSSAPVVDAAPVVVSPAPVVVTPAPVVVTPAPVVVRRPIVIHPRPFFPRRIVIRP
jgi:hypothetical protein